MGVRAASTASTFDTWCVNNPGGTWAQFMTALVGAVGPQGFPGTDGTKIRVTRSTTLVQVLGINVLSLVASVATTVNLTARAP